MRDKAGSPRATPNQLHVGSSWLMAVIVLCGDDVCNLGVFKNAWNRVKFLTKYLSVQTGSSSAPHTLYGHDTLPRAWKSGVNMMVFESSKHSIDHSQAHNFKKLQSIVPIISNIITSRN